MPTNSLVMCTACGTVCDSSCQDYLQHHAHNVLTSVYVFCYWSSAFQSKYCLLLL